MDRQELTDTEALNILRRAMPARKDYLLSLLYNLGVATDRREILVSQVMGDTPTPRRDALLEVLAA